MEGLALQNAKRKVNTASGMSEKLFSLAVTIRFRFSVGETRKDISPRRHTSLLLKATVRIYTNVSMHSKAESFVLILNFPSELFLSHIPGVRRRGILSALYLHLTVQPVAAI